MTYVSDTVDGFIAAAGRGCGRRPDDPARHGHGRVRRGAGRASWRTSSGASCPVELDESRVRPQDSEVERLISTPRLAGELTGWTSRTSLREGLERTITWIEENLARYRADEYVR